jgi:hypothetical protein
MDSSPRISYTPRPGTTSESEAKALAAVYAFVLDCCERRKAAEISSSNEDVEGGEEATPPSSTPGSGLNLPP